MIRICEICKEKIQDDVTYHDVKGTKNFFTHVRRSHNINAVEYTFKYVDVNFKFEKCGWCNNNAVPQVNENLKLYYAEKMLCDTKECKKERKKHNPRSYIAAMKTYKLSEEDAKKKVQSASPFHRLYFKTDEQYKNFQDNASLDSYIKRLGEIEGKKQYEQYRNNISYINSEQRYVDEYGCEEGLRLWSQISKEKAITRDKLRKIYGIEDGDRRYEKFLDKTLKNFISKISIEYLDYISKHFNLNIRHGKNSTSEKKIKCQNTIAPVDGYCQDLDIVFEFFGDKWHANPKKHDENSINPHGMTGKRVWQKDAERLQQIIPNTKAIFICWEYDWIHNRDQIIYSLSNYLDKFKNGQLSRGAYYL